MPPVRLVSFDAFETLIFPRYPPAVVYARAAREANVTVDPAQVAPTYQEAYLHYRKKYPNFGHYAGLPADDWWAKVIRRALRPFLAPGQELSAAFCAALYDRYKSPELWRLEAGAVSCLEAIRGLQPRRHLCVLSNFDERLPQILTALGISHHFDDILFSCDFPCHKPDARFFRLLLDRHPTVAPDKCLHIGNSLQRDYEASRQVGMRALLYRPIGSPEKTEPGVCSIENLMEILPLLEE